MTYVYMGGVPLPPEEPSVVHDWGLLGFHAHDGMVTVVASALAPSLHYSRPTFLEHSQKYLPPSMGSFHFSTMAPPYDTARHATGSSHESPISAGDRFWFVLMVNATAPTDFGVALANMTPQSEGFVPFPPPAIDASSIHPEDCANIQLRGRTVDAGFNIAIAARYVPTSSLSVPPTFGGYDVRTEGVRYRQTLPVGPDPIVTNEFDYETEREGPPGWSVAAGSYESTLKVGTWAVDAAIRNRTLAFRGATANFALHPSYVIVAEGAGPTRSSFDFTGVSLDILSDILFLQVDIDQPLSDLFGMPIYGFERHADPLVGRVPPIPSSRLAGGILESTAGMIRNLAATAR